MNNPTHQEEQTSYRSLTRVGFLELASTALEANAWRFARDILLEWLGLYPGDLQAGLFYAQALLGEGNFAQAGSILEGLYRADPEFVAVVETALSLERRDVTFGTSTALTSRASASNSTWADRYYALTGRNASATPPSVWAQWLSEVRLALEERQYPAARGMIERLIEAGELNELIGATHLRILHACDEAPLQDKIPLAEAYAHRWPENLMCMVVLAHLYMLNGDSGRSVTLLHQAAARDVGGQVAERLWGADHPYRQLWPEVLDLTLRLPIPAEIAARLGWNRLPSQGQAIDSGFTMEEKTLEAHIATPALPEWLNFHAEKTSSSPPISEAHFEGVETLGQPLKEEQEDSGKSTPSVSLETEEIKAEAVDVDIEIPLELERLASKFKKEGLHQVEARFPVYVVVSARGKIEAQYGEAGYQEVQHALHRLVTTVQRRKGWDACLLWLDDASSCSAYGLRAISANDPWEVKLALRDLDVSLGKRGEMIGALLIVGGEDVVPFHQLPNPVDDDDVTVPSDNPYATRGENYFVPEWPVGRLPTGKDVSKEWLLDVLEHITRYHAQQLSRKAWYLRWLQALKRKILFSLNGSSANFGYSAAAWREAARAVYKAIGDADELYLSPPMGVGQIPVSSASLDEIQKAISLYGVPTLAGRLGYFNLHGMMNATEWYGQAEAEDYSQMPTLPIALDPAHIRKPKTILEGNLPAVIFSEACYGAFLQNRSEQQSIALKFLQCGSLAFIGSTCMSYGTVDTPLQAADLLASFFWRVLKEGTPAGEALRLAKLELAMEMDRRQGYLDGEDQKTLISFVLYGDPLAMPEGMRLKGKGYRRQLHPIEEFEVVCDRTAEHNEEEYVPEAMVSYVRELVAKYLPGMEGAQMRFASEHAACRGENHTCPTSQLRQSHSNAAGGQAKNPRLNPSRQLVTLSKRIVSAKGEHTHYARLTLNEAGRLVKLVVSR